MPRLAVDGVLMLDKPPGITSNAALQKMKRLYNAAKAGHTGTLDPLANGLLPLCFGEATKFAGELLSADKSYRATLLLGIRTSTGDAEGEIVSQRPAIVERGAMEQTLLRFRGEIDQLPPMYSALKYEGRNYYEYARAGIDIPRETRRVRIHELILEAWDPPQCTVYVRCSKGTYVRTLAEDIGETLGCGAHLTALRRTGIGGYLDTQAHTVAELEAMTPAQRTSVLLPADTLIRHLPARLLPSAMVLRIRLGQAVCEPIGGDSGPCRLYDEQGTFLGLGEMQDGEIRPKRLLASTPQNIRDGAD